MVVELTAPCLSSRYLLHASRDADAATTGQAGAGIVLSSMADASLVDWILVSSRLFAACLMTSANINSRRGTRRRLFVIAAYAAKDAFYQELNTPLRIITTSHIMVVTEDMNV